MKITSFNISVFLLSLSFLKPEVADRPFGQKLQILEKTFKIIPLYNWEASLQQFLLLFLSAALITLQEKLSL